MADTSLSSISTTTTLTGTYLYIIIPDGGSPTGFSSRRITLTNLLTDIQSEVDDNTFDISAIDTRVTALETLGSKSKYVSQTASFQHTQSADSTLYKIIVRDINEDGATFRIGTSSEGEQIQEEITLSSTYNWLYELDIDLISGYSSAGRTIYITVVSGTMTFTLLSRLDEF